MRMPFRYVSLVAAAALIALVATVGGGVSVPSAGAVLNDSDGDTVIDLAEVITGSDPNDAHKTPEDVGADSIIGTLLCGDGVDNDGDGDTDGDDLGCADSDNDIVSDQTETILGSDPNNGTSFPEDARFDSVLESLGYGFLQTCIDGIDNDGDGAADAADSACDPILGDQDAFDDRVEKLFGSDPSDPNSVPEHESANPGSCSDGTDNDRDSTADANDEACQPVNNDSINGAVVIDGLPFEDSQKISAATAEASEPQPSCFYRPPATVWYRYTASSDGVFVADSAGSNFHNTVVVWTRRGNRFTEQSCATSSSGGPFSPVGARAAFQAVAGETYYIQAGGYVFPSEPANLHLSVDNGHPPANDDFATPRVIGSLPFIENLNAADATSEFGEPAGRCGSPEPVSSVWYRYAPSREALLVADTRGSNYPTAISVWTGSQFGLAEIACVYYEPRVAFSVDAGRTYYVQVTSPERGAAGALHFSLSEGESPSNDDFSAATNIASLPYEDTVDAFTATTEGGEPEPSCSFGDLLGTVWYKTTAPQSGYMKTYAETSGGGSNVALAVYQGSSLDDLNELTCTYPYYYPYRNTVAFPVTAGQTYYFQVGSQRFRGGKVPTVVEAGKSAGFIEESGVITFELETLVIPPCAPSEFTFSDPLDDQVGGFGPPPGEGPDVPPDVTSVSGGSDGSNFCLRVELDRPLPEPSRDRFQTAASAQIEFDTDENIDTGYGRLRYDCGAAIGVEVGANLILRRDVLVPLEISFSGPVPIPEAAGFPPPPETRFGFATYGERSFQLIVPMDVLGDDNFRLAAAVYGQSGYDCVPNAGVVVSPEQPTIGDVNCDGATNSLDSALILQRFANLLFQQLPCEYVGDVNQNGGVGPVDAVLILQYSSGMLADFSPAG